MKRLLIRADDLGFSEGINYGIQKSVKDGIIRSVGLMPNMPAAAHGVSLLAGLPVCFGQHTNISVGRPLTDPERIPSITKENGEFKSSREYRVAKQDFVVLDEVVLEIEAQYRRFIELIGLKPHYFEGHAVASRNFFRGLQIVAERHGLDYFELNPGGMVCFRNTRLYIHMESMTPGYDPKRCLMNLEFHEGEREADLFVCHPGYLAAYVLKESSLTVPRAMEVEAVCSKEVREWAAARQIRLISYDDIL